MHWQRAVERSRAKGEGGRKPAAKVRLVLSWSIEMNRWTGKEDEFHELVGLLEFLFVLSMTGVSKWSVLEIHPPIELHRHSGKTVDIIYELVHYFGHVCLLKSSFSWRKWFWLSQDMFLLPVRNHSASCISWYWYNSSDQSAILIVYYISGLKELYE